jgi:hypothetical protein
VIPGSAKANKMKFGSFHSRALVSAVLLLPFSAYSHEYPLSLKHGVYVSESVPCKGAPNAQILFWDGVGFSGAHSSQCTSRVERQDGSRYQISTICAAAGDGSKNAIPTPYTDSFMLRRLSITRFEFLKDTQRKSVYRWCAAKDLD